ncbi:MAG TPA: DUF881 domain-containing protein [Candidatus Limnocylindria bacterium]|nr:DUF881 domain-containing protein [Candidatus Limnocylindria bacterium]
MSTHFSVAAVAALLGMLVVGQLRGQAGVPGLSALSATELTQLIANLTTRNEQLRTEISGLARQESNLAAARNRGETTVGELTSDLARIRAWAGLTDVMGQGIAITVSGPIGGDGIEELLNELRNAGAEAIAVDGVRVVAGTVVAGAPGALSVENEALGDAFEIRAIGSPQILTGTLTRTGGVIAQIGATYPDARLTVSPVETMTLPATERDLGPTDASPRL